MRHHLNGNILAQSQHPQARNIFHLFPNFMEGYFFLVVCGDFTVGEKLQLCWRGPRVNTKSLSNYVKVEDLHTGYLDDIHRSRIKFYKDASLNAEVIISHGVT